MEESRFQEVAKILDIESSKLSLRYGFGICTLREQILYTRKHGVSANEIKEFNLMSRW